MIINFIGNWNSEPTLATEQSRSILTFCRAEGVSVFTVNFLFAAGEVSERLAGEFFQRIKPYSAGKQLLEGLDGNLPETLECWHLNEESIEAILQETDGDLFSYNILEKPEDWLFYAGSGIFLQVISHEQEATMRLTEAQYVRFRSLGIPHGLGCPDWSGLPEEPRGTV